jgi:hypothetical protein
MIITTPFSWKNEPELMARLTTAQDSLNTPIDIVTFAGMCASREELERHVAYYEQRVAQQSKPRARKYRPSAAESECSERQGDLISMFRREY